MSENNKRRFDRLQTVDPAALHEAISFLEAGDAMPAIIRPRLARAILFALSEQEAIIERFVRTSQARRLSFEAALQENAL